MSEPLYILRRSDVAARRFGDELMIMSARDSSLFSLNETAALLWEAADGTTPLEVIVQRDVCATFDVDPSAALADSRDIALQLAERGILQVSSEPFGDEAIAERTT